jgi:hypothetical protein
MAAIVARAAAALPTKATRVRATRARAAAQPCPDFLALLNERLSHDLSSGRSKSIGGNLNVDDEGS